MSRNRWRSCRAAKAERIRSQIEEKKERRKMYLDREKEMLNKEGVQQYAVGSRSLTRYSTDLRAVQDIIDQLDDEIAELERILCGGTARKAVGVVPRDDW